VCTPLSPPHKHREMLPPTFAGVWCNAGTADLQLLHKKFAYAPQIEAASKLMGCCMWRPSRWPDALMLATSSQCAVRTVLASPDRRSRAQQQAEPAQLARRCLYRAGAGACGCACQRSCITSSRTTSAWPPLLPSSEARARRPAQSTGSPMACRQRSTRCSVCVGRWTA
jgi:hypothetical protein